MAEGRRVTVNKGGDSKRCPYFTSRSIMTHCKRPLSDNTRRGWGETGEQCANLRE